MVLNSAHPLSLYLSASPYTQRFFLQKLWLPPIFMFFSKNLSNKWFSTSGIFMQ